MLPYAAPKEGRRRLRPRSLAAISLFLIGGLAGLARGVTPAVESSTSPIDTLPGSDWPSYNKTLDGQRHSPLTQITAQNVASLTEVCRIQVSEKGSFSSGLVVVNGTLYATTATDTIALDPATCVVKWRHVYHRTQPGMLPVNRGVAYLNGRLYRGTDDARVIALDARTGDEVWTSVIGDARLGETLSASPIAWNGLVIIGTAVGELGIRGRIVALDAATGREVWRFNTIPLGNEPGAETWGKSQWAAHGGGGSWSHYAIDPVTSEVFISVGNPIPAFTPADRPGSNLYTNSVVVLDANTGRVKWSYKQNPNDAWDHDLAAAPLLYRNSQGAERIAAAGKNGYVDIIDRATHKMVARTAVTTVDAIKPQPSVNGVKVCPGVAGGVGPNGPSFDPDRQLLFVGAYDYCSVFRSQPHSTLVLGGPNYGGSWAPGPDAASGWVTALDAGTGMTKWKYHAEGPVGSGITSTAGGIVMAGDNAGNFLVFDSSSGTLLKRVATGGAIAGGVITYLHRGKQFVALTSGNTSRSVFGEAGRPTIIVMGVPNSGSENAAPRSVNAEHGKELFLQNCAICHGADGKNIVVRGGDLTTIRDRMTQQQLEVWIRNPKPPMPKVFAEPLTENDQADVRDIAHYLHDGQ